MRRQYSHPIKGGECHLRDLPCRSTTAKGRAIYVNEAQRDYYPAILTRPLSPLGRPIFFSEEDAYVIHFSHNDALVVTIHIGYYQVSKIFVEGGSSVKILYGHAPNVGRSRVGQKEIIRQTQSLLYGFNRSEARSLSTIEFLVRADPYNVVTEFCVLDIASPYNAILGRP